MTEAVDEDETASDSFGVQVLENGLGVVKDDLEVKTAVENVQCFNLNAAEFTFGQKFSPTVFDLNADRVDSSESERTHLTLSESSENSESRNGVDIKDVLQFDETVRTFPATCISDDVAATTESPDGGGNLDCPTHEVMVNDFHDSNNVDNWCVNSCLATSTIRSDSRDENLNNSKNFNANQGSSLRTSENDIVTLSFKAENQSGALNQTKVEDPLFFDVKSLENPDELVYEFELPQVLCGRLIGKQKRNIQLIMEKSNTHVSIKNHPSNPELRIVSVKGSEPDVVNALEIIRGKYPPSRYPTISLVQTNIINSVSVPLPDSSQLHLPEATSCDVFLSSLISAGHFFLQQPTHPTYSSLRKLDHCMIQCYSEDNAPPLPQPIEAGVICVAPVYNGWYRAQIINVYDCGNECEIKFVDYGGFQAIPISALRQIRVDFMTLPFQATECYLANVRPVDLEVGWTPEAKAAFEKLAVGQMLQALVVGYDCSGTPCVHLYRIQGVSILFINKELVERGFAVWVNDAQ